MGFLNKSFGRRRRTPSPEELPQTILAFIRAKTQAESRRILEAHPELLSDEADDLLGQLAEAQGDEGASGGAESVGAAGGLALQRRPRRGTVVGLRPRRVMSSRVDEPARWRHRFLD